jgi:hypothetical protein
MTINVEMLAREAGGRKSSVIDFVAFSHEELEHFAALVLEAAAVQCDEAVGLLLSHGSQPGINICVALRDAIRAMKPGVKP